MVKLLRATADGRERIVRVMRPGDVIGLEALATARYDSEAIALVEAQVCRIPLSVLHHLSAKSPRLHKRLMQKCQQALKDAEDWLADLNFGSIVGADATGADLHGVQLADSNANGTADTQSDGHAHTGAYADGDAAVTAASIRLAQHSHASPGGRMVACLGRPSLAPTKLCAEGEIRPCAARLQMLGQPACASGSAYAQR